MGSLSKQRAGIRNLGSCILGAFLPTVLLVFLASDRVGDRLSSISSLGNGYLSRNPAQDRSNLTNSHGPAPSGEEGEHDKFPGLAELLPKVATEDGTVIITSVNEAWARPNSLMGLFRESFRNGEGIAHLLNHTLIVALDEGGFKHCRAVHPHCYLLQVKGMNLSSANQFLTKGYLEVVWIKLSIQQRVLELGYNYLFTDVDILWLRNPFRHINLYADVSMSCDKFSGDPDSLRNSPNTGFYYVKSRNRTVEMLRQWQAARSRFRPDHDQTIFNNIKHEIAGELGVKIQFLDTRLFSGFCAFRDEMEGVFTMHANCCVGLENKVHDLRNVIADWKNYTGLMSSASAEKNRQKPRWTFPAKCKESMRQF
ncbi:hypothetical protein ACP4OV_012839 [Aristida adscensionis]